MDTDSSSYGGADAALPITGELYAALLNLSGKRRFLSQRIVLYAVLASHKRPGALFTALESLDMMRHTHAALMERKGGMPGVFCRELHDAYFDKAVADMRIRSFIDLAEGTLDALGRSVSEAEELLSELIDSATPILEVLDRLTLVYENLAKDHSMRSKNEMQRIMADIGASASEGSLAIIEAQKAAARTGSPPRELTSVADAFSNIRSEIDVLSERLGKS